MTKNTKKKIETIKVDSFKVLKVREMKKSDNVSFDLVLNGITIYGCFVISGKNGDFISLPQRAGNDGKYYSIVWAPMSQEDQDAIIAEVERLLNE